MADEKRIETEYLKTVLEFIENETVRLSDLIVNYRSHVKEQGSKFNLDNPNGGMYSGSELTELHYEMENQMQQVETAKYYIWFFDRLKKSPYFARVDFTPEKTGKKQVIYIGLKTLQDPDTYDTLVCDWRAPVSTLFYEDFESTAFFNAPMGKISGIINLKRQFKIRDGKLEYFVDSDIKIDDEILVEALSESTKEHLKVIVSSIQREQNRAIRYSDDKSLIVTGPAGSGKTSVGFHRLAFLLYRNRNELTSSDIVMFSNSDIFSSYVADIIPELGEMPINYADFYSVFRVELSGFLIGDYYSLADCLISKDKLRRKSIELKYSEPFINYLKAHAENYIPTFSDIKVFDETIISSAQLSHRYDGEEKLTASLKAERLTSFADSIIDEYFREHERELYEIIDKTSALDEDTKKLLIVKRREIKRLSSDNIRSAIVAEPAGIYKNILADYILFTGKDYTDVLTATNEKISKGILDFEDALAILFVKSVMGDTAVLSGVKHVLIDEAQDMCLLQHKIIRTMFPKAKFTLLCDKNQAIVPEINTADYDSLISLYDANSLYLDKSYRSTKKINEYALSLLNEDEKYDIFERDGEDVAFIKASDYLTELKNELLRLASLSASTCIITKTIDEAQKLHAALFPYYNGLKLCDNKSAEFTSAPTIMPLVLTKGLEFDNVIVVDKGNCFDGDENRRYLYMASTRALHRLTIIKD